MSKNDGRHLIVPGDFLKTLENCEGHYMCPIDPITGELLGPVVGYAGEYDAADGSKKKWVGLAYYNFSKADPYPAVLTFSAEVMASQLKEKKMVPDLIVGAPWAGVKFSQEVARILGCRHIFAEKNVIGFDENGKKIEKLILGRYEGEINPGERVLIGEELVNNLSTTGKLVNLIEETGGIVIGISCAINRSYSGVKTFWDAPRTDSLPIIGVIEIPTPQYKQDDQMVAKAIESGNVVWKPKYAWDKMKAAMDWDRRRY